MTNYIYINTQFEGFHCWKEAPIEVSFLRNFHRHMFKVKVWIEVRSNDREIEFFMFKKDVNNIIKDFLYVDDL